MTGGTKKGMLLGAFALAVFMVGPAMAADMPAKAPVYKAVPPPAAYNWTGFFTGASVGGQSWDISGIYVTPPNDHHITEGTKGVLGGHVGAQYQVNSWVLGVEAAYNSTFDHTLTTSLSPSPDCLASVGNQRCDSRVNNTWTAGGRVGYAWDRFMVYGSGGFANGNVQSTTSNATTGALTSSTGARQNGWYGGVGAEYFVTKFLWSDLILGAEYQHIDLSSSRQLDVLTGNPGNGRDMKATEDVARARMIFKWTP